MRTIFDSMILVIWPVQHSGPWKWQIQNPALGLDPIDLGDLTRPRTKTRSIDLQIHIKGQVVIKSVCLYLFILLGDQFYEITKVWKVSVPSVTDWLPIDEKS